MEFIYVQSKKIGNCWVIGCVFSLSNFAKCIRVEAPRTVNDVWHRLKEKGVLLAYVNVALHFTAENWIVTGDSESSRRSLSVSVVITTKWKGKSQWSSTANTGKTDTILVGLGNALRQRVWNYRFLKFVVFTENLFGRAWVVTSEIVKFSCDEESVQRVSLA